MDMSTTKTVVVFAIIFGCFAILYPKIFHPMVLHIFGFASQKPASDDIHEMAKGFGEVNRVPPHLRKGPGPARVLQEDITRHVRDEIPGSFRPGPHPGLRAAAEMKKQAATTTGTGKGMMGVVLPMYAVGIVIYLIYTLTKVFGKKEEKKEDFLSNNPFNDIQYDANKKEFKYSDGQEDSEDEKATTKAKAQQRDLERLLLRADERNIRYKQLRAQILSQSVRAVESEGNHESRFTLLPPFRIYSPKKRAEIEMRQLKARLMETEAQMSRILKAMETVSDKVIPKEDIEDDAQAEEAAPKEPASPRTVDSSPDMESYEIIDRSAPRSPMDSPVEDVGPAAGVNDSTEEPQPNLQKPVEVQSEKQSNSTEDVDVNEKDEPSKQQESVEESMGGESTDESAGKACVEAEPCSTPGDEPEAAAGLDEKIPEKKEEKPQEPRPDLRKRKQGKKARRDN